MFPLCWGEGLKKKKKKKTRWYTSHCYVTFWIILLSIWIDVNFLKQKGMTLSYVLYRIQISYLNITKMNFYVALLQKNKNEVA